MSLVMKISEIRGLKPVYIIPKDNIADELLIPVLKCANRYDIMSAFFHSNALKELAPGLSCFLNTNSNIMRLIISPNMSNKEIEAIENGVKNPEDVLNNWLSDYMSKNDINTDLLQKYTLECLSYLILKERIKIKIAYMNNGSLFHSKISILSDANDSLVIHGSTNFTHPGLTKNRENARVERSWGEKTEVQAVKEFKNEFENVWNNLEKDIVVTYPISNAIKDNLLKKYRTEKKPHIDDYYNIVINSIRSDERITIRTNPKVFSIPDSLSYREGDFKHQGLALDAWLSNQYRGILQMCTGSGKTITSLLCAKYLHSKINPLLIVISAPYIPLVNQWKKETEKFGLNPVLPGNTINKTEKFKSVYNTINKLKYNISNVECLIVTNNLLCNDQFHQAINHDEINVLLISDEMHNLGTKSFASNEPKFIKYRLGLSATPIRQYDETGTENIFKYFGDVVYEYNLEDAIGKCLVPYNYFVHPVSLNTNEAESWLELTDKLKKIGFIYSKDNVGRKVNKDVDDSHYKSLLLRRRKIIEQAESKYSILYYLLKKERNLIKHTLVYLSDKCDKQIKQVNSMLMNELNLLIHQVTQKETSSGISSEILQRFSEGRTLQVLTAMRVLDEGIDIPQVTTAYILASTTVERQWTQRRGRVMRKCPSLGKTIANIHDFFVFGPNHNEFNSLIKSEFTRIMEFAKLSNNAFQSDGAIEKLKPFKDKIMFRSN
jgi:superfamily II DNA or RNA helicase